MSNMSHTLSAARRRYVPNGNGASLDCDDTVAHLLRGHDAREACTIADLATGNPIGHHWAKYAHLKTASGELNVGAIRMNAGNVIRGAMRRRV